MKIIKHIDNTYRNNYFKWTNFNLDQIQNKSHRIEVKIVYSYAEEIVKIVNTKLLKVD